MSVIIEMSDRDIRRILQKHGYWYANSTETGPAHICKERTGRHAAQGLCGQWADTTIFSRATNICKACRKIAVKQIAQAVAQ